MRRLLPLVLVLACLGPAEAARPGAVPTAAGLAKVGTRGIRVGTTVVREESGSFSPHRPYVEPNERPDVFAPVVQPGAVARQGARPE